MTTVAFISSIASLALFAGFIILSTFKFGLQGSYSAFAPKWTEAVPLASNVHLWSIVTAVTALLLIPAVLESGENHGFQFLGFFAPLYLVAVACTPEYQTNKKQKVVHIICTVACAVVSLLWLFFVRHDTSYVFFSLIIMWIAGIVTKTINSSLLFWCEMAMFSAVYASLLL